MTAMARFTLLLLVLWLGVAVAAVVDLQKRIIGGRNCQATERQYHVRLIISNGNNRNLCGGSLISNQWILTAAHCLPNGGSVEATLGDHPGTNPRTVPIPDKDILRYFDNNRDPHDIALLKLPQPVTDPLVQLPNCGNPPNVGDMVQVAGHGSTTMAPNNDRQPGFTPALQCADIQIVACSRNFVVSNGRHKHRFCGRTPNVDTCLGDSGGGVVFNNMIYGVHSSGGITACTSAATFMDVCKYIGWINRIITPNIG